jgi:hypothetical protein
MFALAAQRANTRHPAAAIFPASRQLERSGREP